MSRAVRFAGLLIVLLAGPAVASAAGLLVPRGGGEPIAIRSHRVTATVTDGVARTKVRQTFVNTNPRTLEAIYVFPLPEDAALVSVAMEVGGQRLEGLLAERKRARKVYDDIVRRKKDPALVEQIGRGKFRLSVFPVVPNEPTVVEITYLEHLPLSQGEFRYVYPLALGGGVATTLEDLTVSVTLRSSAPLTEVRADAADAEVVRRGPGEAIVSLERNAATLDRDLVVTGRLEVPEGARFSSDAATSAAILARIFCGEDPRKSEWIGMMVRQSLSSPPRWSDGESPDMGQIYFGTMALFQVGGEAWKKWNAALKSALIGTQVLDPPERRGCWETAGPGGRSGDPVRTTALACMSMEVYGRYGRVFAQPK